MPDLTDKLNNIEHLRQQIEAKGKLPEEVLRKIEYKFRLECNYNSNRIEGGTLTKPETRSVMVGNITVQGRPLKDIREMKGHDEVMQQILGMGKGELTLSEKRILDIHKTIIVADKPEGEQEIGVWKKQGNHIINYRGEKFEFTPPDEVPDAIHELLNWVNADVDRINRGDKNAPHPLLLAFEFHLRFLTIHPFSDGNGRTARLLTNLILIALGYPPFWVGEGGEKDAYNRYLADVQAYGGGPDLLYMFLAGLVERSLKITMDAIEGKEIEDVDDWEKKLRLLKSNLPGEEFISVRKSDDVLDKVFRLSILPTLRQTIERLTEFDELFVEKQLWFGCDQTYEPIRSIEDVQKVWQKSLTRDKVTFDYSLKAFKKASKPFGVDTRLEWEMEEFRYALFANFRKEAPVYNLKYTDYYSESDVANIVKLCAESLLDGVDMFLKIDNR